MSRKSEEIVDKAIKDPEKLYQAPDSVLRDARLTRPEKEKILDNWELDQLALLRAEEENMTPKTNTAPAVDLLEKVKKAEKRLANESKDGCFDNSQCRNPNRPL